MSLYRQHKLGHDAYMRLSARVRDGHDRRRASSEAARATEAALAFEQERAWARRQLEAKALPFKPLCPDIDRWRMGYEELEERYCMLVLYGPSRAGKSRLARSLFGFDRTLVIDVQHAKRPDLHGFRRGEHMAILLDEVADPSFIVNNKKLLQAHVDGAILGQSATQTYTYEVFLWRIPIILTTNNWDLTRLTEAELDWVRANCVAVHVAEPVFEARREPKPTVQVQSRPRPQRRVEEPAQQPEPELQGSLAEQAPPQSRPLTRRRPAAAPPRSSSPATKRLPQR